MAWPPRKNKLPCREGIGLFRVFCRHAGDVYADFVRKHRFLPRYHRVGAAYGRGGGNVASLADTGRLHVILPAAWPRPAVRHYLCRRRCHVTRGIPLLFTSILCLFVLPTLLRPLLPPRCGFARAEETRSRRYLGTDGSRSRLVPRAPEFAPSCIGFGKTSLVSGSCVVCHFRRTWVVVGCKRVEGVEDLLGVSCTFRLPAAVNRLLRVEKEQQEPARRKELLLYFLC